MQRASRRHRRSGVRSQEGDWRRGVQDLQVHRWLRDGRTARIALSGIAAAASWLGRCRAAARRIARSSRVASAAPLDSAPDNACSAKSARGESARIASTTSKTYKFIPKVAFSTFGSGQLIVPPAIYMSEWNYSSERNYISPAASSSASSASSPAFATSSSPAARPMRHPMRPLNVRRASVAGALRLRGFGLHTHANAHESRRRPPRVRLQHVLCPSRVDVPEQIAADVKRVLCSSDSSSPAGVALADATAATTLYIAAAIATAALAALAALALATAAFAAATQATATE